MSEEKSASQEEILQSSQACFSFENSLSQGKKNANWSALNTRTNQVMLHKPILIMYLETYMCTNIHTLQQ